MSDTISYPDERGAWPYLLTATLLTALLTVAVPVLSFVSSVSTEVLVLLVGVVYLGFLLATGTTAEGLAASVSVLALFDIVVVSIEGPGIAALDLLAVDIVIVPLLVFLSYRALTDGLAIRFDSTMVPTFGFAAFVSWTFAAAIGGSGPSELAAVMFAVEQLRYLALFALAAWIVSRTNVWSVIYPFVVAAAGNLLVSLAQIVNGGRLGFSFLGEPGDRFLGSFVLGVFEFETGFHAGGFVGHGRELVMVLMLALPLAVAISMHGSRKRVLPVGLAAGASILSIRVADTDAGWATLILLCVALGAYLLARSLARVRRRRSLGVLGVCLGSVLTAGVVLAGLVGAAMRSASGPVPLLQTNTLEPRLVMYADAIRIGFEHPMFGLGGRNFYLLYDTGVHNTFLSHLATTGVVGLALYSIAVISALYVALELAVRSRDDERLLWIAMEGAMLSFHSYSSWMFAFHWTVGNSAFWLLTGATVGAAISRHRRRGSARRHILLRSRSGGHPETPETGQHGRHGRRGRSG